LLGPSGRGNYALALAVISIAVQLGVFGMHSSNTFFASRDKNIVSELAGNSIVLSVIISAIISAVLYGAYILGFFPVIDIIFFFMVNLIIFLNINLALFQGILTGADKIFEYNFSEVILKTSSLVYILFFFLLFKINVNIALGSIAFSMLIAFWYCYKIVGIITLWRLKLSWNFFIEAFRYGLKINISAIFIVLLLKSNIFFLKQFVSIEDVGQYSLALNISDVMYTLPVSIGTILFPKLSALNSLPDRLLFFSKTIKNASILIAIINVIAILLSPKIIILFFGTEFSPAVDIFITLMPFNLVFSINTLYMQYFASRGVPSVAIYSPMAALAINVLFNSALIPVSGSIGASISLFLAVFIMLLFSWRFMENERAYISMNYCNGKFVKHCQP